MNPNPATATVDWAALFMTFAMILGFAFSVLMLIDAVQDRRVVVKADPPLPRDDGRRPLSIGFLAFTIGYLIFKAVCLYLAFGLLFQLPERAVVARLGLGTSVIISDIGVGIFWHFRKRAL